MLAFSRESLFRVKLLRILRGCNIRYLINFVNVLFFGKLLKMEFGEPILDVCAFPGVNSLCSFIGENGRIGVFDMETSRITYDFKNKRPIINFEADDDKNLYFCDTGKIYRHDLRTSAVPEVIFTSKTNILSFSKNEERIAISCEGSGIELQDERKLLNVVNESPISANLVKFLDHETLLSNYADGSLRVWKYDSEVSQDLEVPTVVKARKMECLGTANFDKTLAVCYKSGISIYKNYTLQEHATFGKTCFFESMCYAPCFDNEYIAFSTSESEIVPVNLETMETATSKTFNGAKVKKLSANFLMLASANLDEFDGGKNEGFISTLMPEDFSDEFF